MRRELILESFNCSPNLFWDWGWSMLMRFITQLGDGKGFYGEDNDRRDLPWCNAVKHPESSRNHLLSQVSVQSQSGFRIWFLWTQDGGGGGGQPPFFLTSLLQTRRAIHLQMLQTFCIHSSQCGFQTQSFLKTQTQSWKIAWFETMFKVHVTTYSSKYVILS